MDEVLSEIERSILYEIEEFGQTLPDLLYYLIYNWDDPSYKIYDFYRSVYETVESLRLKGFIELVLIQYTKVTDIRREVVSVEPVPDDAIPAILGNPDNWGRAEVIRSLERYTYRTTEKGEEFLDSLV